MAQTKGCCLYMYGSRVHPITGCKDIFILEGFKYELEPGKTLEERQATTARIREKYPDKIPVVIVNSHKKCGKTHTNEILSLLAEAKSTKGHFLCKVANIMYPTNDHGEFTCWDVKTEIKTPMSSLYDRHKDNDGIFYMKLAYAEGLPKYVSGEPNKEEEYDDIDDEEDRETRVRRTKRVMARMLHFSEKNLLQGYRMIPDDWVLVDYI